MIYCKILYKYLKNSYNSKINKKKSRKFHKRSKTLHYNTNLLSNSKCISKSDPLKSSADCRDDPSSDNVFSVF